MRTCEFCAATLLGDTTECESCGRTMLPIRTSFARDNSLQTTHIHDANTSIPIDVSYSNTLPSNMQRGRSLWAYDIRSSSQKEPAREGLFLPKTQLAEKLSTTYRRIGLLTAVMVLVVIFSSIAGFEVGRLTPVLRLVEATHATLGDLLHVQGQNFIAGGIVILSRDKSSSLTITLRPTFQTIHTKSGVQTVPNGTQGTISGNTLTLDKSGTFDITILVNENWSIGRHTIQASEQFGLLRAEISFNVLRPPHHSTTSMIIPSERI